MRKLILILTLGGILQGCGTDTGNPGLTHSAPEPSPGNPELGQGRTLAFLPATMCLKLRSCWTGVPADCEERLFTQALSVTSELGLDALRDPTLASADQGIVESRLHFQAAEAGACDRAMRDLSCDEPLVGGSYDPSEPEGFEGVHALLRASPSCRRMIY